VSHIDIEDIANALCVLCMVLGLRLTNRLDRLAFWVLLLRVCMVFFTNDVLFPVSYMPDQLRYIRCAIMYRGEPSEWCMRFGYAVTVSSAAKVFAAFPMPFMVSVRSTSLVNMTLVIWMYLLLHRGGFLTEESRKFFLLYPSFILYSAIGVRDIFILLSMMMALYFLFERRQFLLGLACTYPLMFIKPQNFFMILVPFALTALAGESRGRMIMTVVLGFIFTFAMLLGAGYLGELNTYRANFYLEDGGMGQVELLSASPYLAIQLLSSAIGVLLMPMPWQAGGAFQLIQSVENLIVGAIVFAYWRRQPKPGMENKFLNLKLFLFSSMMIYGAVIFNYGTAARYRFPFLLLFVLFADRMTIAPAKKPKLDKTAKKTS
jgi:hypothetical protein